MNSWIIFGSISVAVGLGAVSTAQSQTNLAIGVAADSEEAMRQKVWDAYNQTRQDRYGKVIDQDGHPVAGVEVTGTIEFVPDDKPDLTYKTQTDANGLFQFTGLHGAGLAVKVAKSGYEMDYRRGLFVPSGQSSPTNRVVYTMWKLKGAEPMIHDTKYYGINPDGRAFTIDLVNKRKIEGTNSMGDLQVQIQRPATIKPKERFDWSWVMTAISGGVIEVTNIGYLYEAPESGYQKIYSIYMTAADPNWQEQIERTFYIESRDGKIFGHIYVTIIPDYHETSFFKIESFINPAGSRNLEFDPQKQIH
jgi:hypothetical protein